MKFSFTKKIIAVMAAAAMLMGVAPSYAADVITVTLEDVTNDPQYAPVFEGEAKIKVSAKGIDDILSIAQLTFDVSGKLAYKDIQSLIEYDKEANLVHGIAKENTLTVSMTYQEPVIELSQTESTDLCVLTFSGKKGDKVTLSLADGDGSWFGAIGEAQIPVSLDEEKTATAAEGTTESVDAKITIEVLTALRDSFNTKNSQIDIQIDGEGESEFSYGTTVSGNIKYPDGVLTVTTKVPKGETFTVKVTGAGYTAYEKTGVDLTKTLAVTAQEFKPGDIDSDGDVDSNDKTKFEEKTGSSDPIADFNRDGKVDSTDKKVFDGITGTQPTPTPTPTPGGSGGGGGGGGGGGAAEKPSSTETPNQPDVPTETPSVGKTFTDLGSYGWAEKYIYTLKEKGIVNGTTENTYSPANNIRRGDFILMLTKMLDISDTAEDNFTDVPVDSYYASAIAAAKAAGIASGDGGKFRPDENITRQDLMALAYRAFLNKGYITAGEDLTVLDAFSDKEMISEYAKVPMAALVKAGIIQGADGKLNPKGSATRAEVAVMCARLLDLLS